jgi:hypothetical protein
MPERAKNNAARGSLKPYFPPRYGNVDCDKCELAGYSCHSWGKYQRNKRDFTVTSGRCPRLPDMRGFVDDKERDLYGQTFPLVHAERSEGFSADDDVVFLTLGVPGKKTGKRIYCTKSGYFYVKTKDDDGYAIKRVIFIETYRSVKDIAEYMRRFHSDYCIFSCEISELTV